MRTDDQVAYGGWAIDLHPPSGVDVPDEPPFTPFHVASLYSIPLRCYHSRNVANLFFAGRNISATHVAFASTRVMATCALGGQAIGTAAALWRHATDRDISNLSTPTAVAELQDALLRGDAFLLDRAGRDATDLAPTAEVSATSAAPGGEPGKVTDGVTRDLRADFGSWSSDIGHAWESAALPATLRFEFASPVSVGEVHLTFDSGFSRELVLTPSDYVSGKTIRGPQPETVQHYRLRCDDEVVVDESGNYLRKRIHRIDSKPSVRVVELEVLRTHGLPVARVFEVRIYP